MSRGGGREERRAGAFRRWVRRCGDQRPGPACPRGAALGSQWKGGRVLCTRGTVGSAAFAWEPGFPRQEWPSWAGRAGSRGEGSQVRPAVPGAAARSFSVPCSVSDPVHPIFFFVLSLEDRNPSLGSRLCRLAGPHGSSFSGWRSSPSTAVLQPASFPPCSAPFTTLGVIRLFCIFQFDEYELTFHLKK